MVVGFDVSVELQTNVSHNTRQAIRDYLRDGAQLGYNWSMQQAPEDTGKLKQTSFGPEFRGEDLVWGYTMGYSLFVEEGTRPHWAPIQPLKDWARRVLGDENAAYAIQQKIAQEGTEGQHFARAGSQRQQEWYRSHSLGKYLDAQG